MSIFDILEQGNLIELQKYLDEHADALSECYESQNNPWTSQIITPIDYAILLNKPEAFGVIYRAMKAKKIKLDNSTIKSIVTEEMALISDEKIRRINEIDAFAARFMAEMCKTGISNSAKDKVGYDYNECQYDYDACLNLLLNNLLSTFSRKTCNVAKDIIKKFITDRFKLGHPSSDATYPGSLLCTILGTMRYQETRKERLEILEHFFKTHSKNIKELLNEKINTRFPIEMMDCDLNKYPIQVAFIYADFEAIQLLVTYGANLNIFDSSGTPLLFLDFIARLSRQIMFYDSLGQDAKQIAAFLFKAIGKLSDFKPEAQVQCLSSMATTCRIHILETLKLFIEHGLNVNTKTHANDTLLHLLATMPTNILPTSDKDSKELNEFILNLAKQIDINTINKMGETALFEAVKSRNVDLVQLFLQLKPDLSLVSFEGFTVLDLAQSLLHPGRVLYEQEHQSRPISKKKIKINGLSAIVEILKAAGAQEYLVPRIFIQAAQGFLLTLPNLESVQYFEDQDHDTKKYAEMLDNYPGIAPENPKPNEIVSETQKTSEIVSETQKAREQENPPDVRKSEILLNHKKLLWDFSLKYSGITLQKLSKNAGTHTAFDFGQGLVLKLYDYTHAEDYQFLVHTTSSNIHGLRTTFAAILNNSADFFIKTAPYFSCSFIDKNTILPEMNHQLHMIFPIGLIIGAESDAILKAFPCDIDSPHGAASDQTKQQYITQLEKLNDDYNAIESRAYELLNTRTWQLINVLKQTKHYLAPSYGNPGYIPALSPKQCLQLTNHSHYNEIIVRGRKNNVVLGIVLEKSWLETFKESNISNQNKEYSKDKFEALQFLVTTLNNNPQIPVIMIDTNKNGYMAKLPLAKRFEFCKKRYVESVSEFSEHLVRKHRFHQVFSKLDKLYQPTRSNQGSLNASPEIQSTLVQIQMKFSKETQDCIDEYGHDLMEAQQELEYIRDLIKPK